MRISRLAVLIVSAFAFAGASHALEGSNTMASWQSATNDEKTKLVTELLKRDGRESAAPSVVKCLNAAASVPGHADLPISQIVKACEADGGEPV